MKEALTFITSKKGKIVIGIIIAIVIAYIIWVQYQKYIYGGYTLKGLAVHLAKQYSQDKVKSIKSVDAGFRNAGGDPSKELDLFRWYDENANYGSDITESWLMAKLVGLKVDFKKHPKVLDIRNDIVENISVVNSFQG